MYLHDSGRFQKYSDLRNSLKDKDSVRHGYPIPPILFQFFIDEIMENILPGLKKGVELNSILRCLDPKFLVSLEIKDYWATANKDSRSCRSTADLLAHV